LKLWTKNGKRQGWKPCTDILEGLERLSLSETGEAFLSWDGSPGLERTVLAAVRLCRRLGPESVRVEVGIVHPTRDALRRLHEAGADAVFLLPKPSRPGEGEPRAGAQDILEDPCPSLHATGDEDAVLSVCGLVGDKLVLPRKVLAGRCLGDFRDCPHRRRKGRD